MRFNGRTKYVNAIAELSTMKFLYQTRQTEKTAFFYNFEDLPNHVLSDPSLLEEWVEVLGNDGVIISDQVHGVF